MSQQLSFFETEPAAAPALAKAPSRKSDPESSHAAGSAMSKGAAKAQADRCVDLVYMQPGSTAAELAKLSKKIHSRADRLTDVQIRKRLPHIETVEAREVRECSVKKNKQQAWYPKDGE